MNQLINIGDGYVLFELFEYTDEFLYLNKEFSTKYRRYLKRYSHILFVKQFRIYMDLYESMGYDNLSIKLINKNNLMCYVKTLNYIMKQKRILQMLFNLNIFKVTHTFFYEYGCSGKYKSLKMCLDMNQFTKEIKYITGRLHKIKQD